MSKSPFQNIASHHEEHKQMYDDGYSFPVENKSWGNRGNPANFPQSQFFFSDIGAFSYSDGVNWQNPIDSIAETNDNVSVGSLFQTASNITTSATNYYNTTDNHNLKRLVISGGIL